jgi:hypothetical protein
MRETTSLTPALSPRFSTARILSRVMAVIFTVAFLVMLFVLIASLAAVMLHMPRIGVGLFPGLVLSLGDLSGWQAGQAMIGIALFLAPTIMTLHHTRKLFACFARGEVFAATPIAHIRWAGLWMCLSYFIDLASVGLLHHCCGVRAIGPVAFLGTGFTGVATTIAAYVMEEARRIAADHAEIV